VGGRRSDERVAGIVPCEEEEAYTREEPDVLRIQVVLV
ncbi:hypothetical protein LINGRAHAP2_LOCUS329, partial [Linum grandiflorum]